MRAWECMVGNRYFNMLDALMFAYKCREKVHCIEQLHATGLSELHAKLRLKVIELIPDLKKSPTPLAGFCTLAGKKAQRTLLRSMNI